MLRKEFVCRLPISEMEKLAEHVGLKLNEYKGKIRLANLKVAHAKVEDELGKTENKVERVAELLEMDSNKEVKEQLEMKLEYEALCKQFQEMTELYKKKMEQAPRYKTIFTSHESFKTQRT